MNTSTLTYKNHRFPPEIISHAVWLYFRFCRSYRDVEELLFTQGAIVTCEAMRKWSLRFGQAYAYQLRRCAAAVPDRATHAIAMRSV